jgi:type II secretory pathway pseudopilin PulG
MRGHPHVRIEGEAGFGLIEIVVSMFLLAIVALALIPVLISGMKGAASNADIAAATQLANGDIQRARSLGSVCSALTAFGAESPAPVTTARGIRLQVHHAPVTCPGTYPGVATVTVSVTRSGGTASLASATTQVYLTSAG